MTIRSNTFLLLSSLLIVSACSGGQTLTRPLASEPDIVTVKLAQAADKASKALDTIASIDQARNPAVQPLEDYSNIPSNLMQPVSVRWTGPIEQITKTLAERAGLRYHTKGNPPLTPLTVTVDAYEQPIVHILRDIGLQAGHRADLAIDSNSGFVEVRYAALDQSVPVTRADDKK